jgi:hypothetical protein
MKMVEVKRNGHDHLTAGKVASDLAKLLAFHARGAPTKEEALFLWRMAQECQAEAARLNDGKAPDIGDPPIRLIG